MIVCDFCNIRLTPDNLAFKGSFLEERIAKIHFCEECSPYFYKEYMLFINRKNINSREQK